MMPWTFELSSGVQVEARNHDELGIFSEVFVEQCYWPTIDALLKWKRTGVSTILDLGCNVGYFSLFVAHHFTRLHMPHFRIVAIDANDELLGKFEDRLKAQTHVRLEGKITTHHGLVGCREGDNLFEVSPHSGISKISQGENPQLKAFRIPYWNLDEVMPGREIDLIKCDIEGAEQELLETYEDTLLQRTRSIVMEIHEAECDAERCRRVLARCGFTTVQREQSGNKWIEGHLRR